jgi:predicted transcriptional regulator
MNKHITVVAREVMQDNFIEIDGLATVKEALLEMKSKKIYILIVKKRNNKDEYGLVLLNDIAKKVLAKNREPERVNVYEIMSKPIIGIDPDMDVRYCARLFDQFGLSVAPVIDDGKVIGVVTYVELVLDGLCKMLE